MLELESSGFDDRDEKGPLRVGPAAMSEVRCVDEVACCRLRNKCWDAKHRVGTSEETVLGAHTCRANTSYSSTWNLREPQKKFMAEAS